MTQLDPGVPMVEDASPPPRIRRSLDDRVIGGVCGGLGRYFGVDPIFFRVAFVVLTIGGGSGVLLYLIGWIVIPEERKDELVGPSGSSLGSSGPMLAGIALVTVGLMLLINNLVPWFDRVMLPLTASPSCCVRRRACLPGPTLPSRNLA